MIEDLKTIFLREGITDDKSLTYICNALVRNNQQGYDYLELKLALDKMSRMDITGDMAVRSAFAAASAMGIDKKKLMDSIAVYKEILIKERTDFDKALQDAMNRKVETRKKDIVEIQNKRLALEAELLRIQAAITASEEQITNARSAIEAASSELATAEKVYHDTCNQVLHIMDEDSALLDKLI